MEKDLVDIVMEKSYIELSANEKAELSEFCNTESEYNQLQDVFRGVEMMQFETFAPKKETKESLDSLFDNTHPKAAPIWYMSILTTVVPKEKAIHRQPLVQIAAVGLLFFLAFPFFQADVTEGEPQLAKLEEVAPTADESVEIKSEIDSDYKMESPAVVAETIDESPVSRNVVLSASAASEKKEELLDPNHSDLNFEESAEIAFSQPASAEPDMLDLLTATF